MTETRKRRSGRPVRERPSAVQAAYLRRGLELAGGKLPIFDRYGQRYRVATIRSCIDRGWAEPWFESPAKPDLMVCRLTSAGRNALDHGKPPEKRLQGPFGQARALQLYLATAV